MLHDIAVFDAIQRLIVVVSSAGIDNNKVAIGSDHEIALMQIIGEFGCAAGLGKFEGGWGQ